MKIIKALLYAIPFIILGSTLAFAAVPIGGFEANETIDPDCSAGDVDCFVIGFKKGPWVVSEDPLTGKEEYLLEIETTTGSSGLKVINNIEGTNPRTANIIGGSFINKIGDDSHASVIGGGGAIYAGPNPANTSTPGANEIGNNSYLSIISGGYDNVILDNSYASSLFGGGHNTIADDSTHTVVGGGSFNIASGHYSTISGGTLNEIVSATPSNNYAVVGGGIRNNINAIAATIPGGIDNTITGNYGAIGGGQQNEVSNTTATIAGGKKNLASGQFSGILGGNGNVASGNYSLVVGGNNNTAIGSRAVVLGGDSSRATGIAALAFGWGAHAQGHGSLAFSDYQTAEPVFTVNQANTFGARYTGGYWLTGGDVGIQTTDPQVSLDIAGSLRMGDGGETCDASVAGAIKYDTTTNKHQGCDGVMWNDLY